MLARVLDDMPTEAERLATLEAQSLEAAKQRAMLHDKLEDQSEDLQAIRSDVHHIKESISGHVGFLKGVVFVFTAVGGALGAVVVAFWDKITGHN